MFVDTNILVHATRQSSLNHGSGRAALLTAHRDGTPLYLSRQVIGEYLAVVTRPRAGVVPFSMEKALVRADCSPT